MTLIGVDYDHKWSRKTWLLVVRSRMGARWSARSMPMEPNLSKHVEIYQSAWHMWHLATSASRCSIFKCPFLLVSTRLLEHFTWLLGCSTCRAILYLLECLASRVLLLVWSRMGAHWLARSMPMEPKLDTCGIMPHQLLGARFLSAPLYLWVLGFPNTLLSS